MENWNQTFKVVISFKMTLSHLMLIMKVIQNGLRESLTILRDDGSLRPNFKPLKVTKGFSVERYTFKVYLELHKALKGLVGNE